VAGEAEERLARGAPKKDSLEMEVTLWNDFRVATSRSLFFCTSSEVQKRLVIRWANVARAKAGSAKIGAVKLQYEAAAKRLQIMETVIKIYRAWQFRGHDTQRALIEFESSWTSLLQFAESQPVESVDCPFIWDLRLQLNASHGRWFVSLTS
jgi:hypothetical protein